MVASGTVSPKVLGLVEEVQGSMPGIEQDQVSARWERTE